jgi:hypothetical protein
MNSLIAALSAAREDALWALLQAGVPALALVEVDQIPGLLEGVCYEYKTPPLGWLPDGIPLLLREMEAGAREYWC